jgi:hypothetical protein
MYEVINRGRFIIESRPVSTPLAKSGEVYVWRVQDLDDDYSEQGLATTEDVAWTCALTVAKARRAL